MKIRNGFVSNSSSSSFVVKKCCLTPSQRYIIRNFTDVVPKIKEDIGHSGYIEELDCVNNFDFADCVKDWEMTEDDEKYYFSTTMDNFELDEFFKELGITISEHHYL